jgi:hypothetical protein
VPNESYITRETIGADESDRLRSTRCVICAESIGPLSHCDDVWELSTKSS